MAPEKELDENYAHGDQDSYNEDLGYENIGLKKKEKENIGLKKRREKKKENIGGPHLKENSLNSSPSLIQVIQVWNVCDADFHPLAYISFG